LAPVAAPVDEQEQVSAHRVATQPGLHQTEEAVVAFAQIRRRGIRPDANRATRAEHHRSARNAATASAMSSPSSRKPDGDTIAIADRPSATTSTGTTLVGAAASADPRSASVHHWRTVSYPSPSSSPIVANRAPAARRRVAYATSLAFSSTGYRLPRPFSCLATSRRSASTSSRFIVSLLCRPTIAARDHAPVRTGQGEHLRLMCTMGRGKEGASMSPSLMWTAIRARVGTRRMRRSTFLELLVPKAQLEGADRDALARELGALCGRDLADSPPIVMKQVRAMARHDHWERLGELAGTPTLVMS